MSILAGSADARRRHAQSAPQVSQLPPQPAPPPPDDTAKFLAGMPVPKDSPLASLTQTETWQTIPLITKRRSRN
ncbi:MAG: hypothetical protein ABJB69_10430 [Spartobacteria bacterium]